MGTQIKNSIGSCKACGIEFGRFGDIKAIGELLSREYLQQRGLTFKEGYRPTFTENGPPSETPS